MPATKKQRTKKAIEILAYTEFLRSLELIGIALIESHCRIMRDEFFEIKEQTLSVVSGARPEEVGKNYFEATAKLTLSVSSKLSKSHEPLLEITAEYRLHIHTTVQAKKEFLERFTQNEIRVIVLPYFREYLSSICGRMHIPPIMLPLGGKL